MTKKVAIVGSGFAAWGAALALAGSDRVTLHVLDIGLTRAEGGWADRPVANAKKCAGSFFCYGINDPRFPVRLETERMCSSHALGGHSTVYSGAILYPLNCDLVAWPAESIPTAEDYGAALSRMPVLHRQDSLDAVFPLVPGHADLSRTPPTAGESSVVGLSRIAARRHTTDAEAAVDPFCVGDEFVSMASAGLLRYSAGCYVSHAEHRDGRVELTYRRDGENQAECFDAVFLGAGCVNTTAIVDRSLGLPGARDYRVRSPSGSIHAFLRLPWMSDSAAVLRKRHGLPEIFLEVRAPGTGNVWGHTQLTPINEQIIDAVCSRLPRLLHGLVKPFRHVLYFALSAGASGDREAAILRSVIEPGGVDGPRQIVSITEYPVPRYPKLVRAVRRAVLRHWLTLRMVPIPFGVQLADFFRRNQLGGWHFGGTLPMRERPSMPTECRTTGELAGLQGVYAIDSAAFPSVPASTVALVTAAHAHRVARSWKARQSANER